jgi:hypothetical protein
VSPAATLRVAAVALVVALGPLFAGPVFAGPALAGPSGVDGAGATPHTAAPAAVAVLGIDRLTPISVAPGETLRVSGTVRNVGTRAFGATTVTLGTSAVPFSSRDSLAADPPATLPVAGAQATVGRVAPGATRRFTLRVDTDSLPLGGFGVYPLNVTATATVGSVATIIATVDTFLPWAPPDPGVQPTRLLWVWPLIDRPARQASGVFVDDHLAPELAPAGRLGSLLSSAAGRQVSWVVDPDLLTSVAAMAAGYDVRTADGVVKGTGTDVARRWLTQLRTATLGGTVTATPYADPDLASVTASAPSRLLRAMQRIGAEAASQVLGRPVEDAPAWPADGQADAAVLGKLSAAHLPSVLLSDTVYPPATASSFTPSGRVDLTADGVPVTPDQVAAGTTVDTAALLADSTLTATVDDPAQTPSDVLLARQRFLAQTQLITAELPSQSRMVVVAPPRRWDPSPALSRSLLAATSAAGWLRPVSLATALHWPASAVTRNGPVTDPLLSPGSLPEGQVDQTLGAMADLRSFATILTQRQPLATDTQSALYAALSTAWLDTPEAGTAWLDAAVATLTDQRSKVRLLTANTATLSSQKGSLPLTVANDLPQAVVVGLDISSDDPLRLQITAPQTVRVGPQHKRSVDVQVEAVTTGTIPVTAQLTDRFGAPFGPPRRIDVQVRAYGRVAVLVVGTAVALLVLAAIVRVVRRIVRNRRGPATS